ncbi:MAG: class I SAM-dependent methyltransferase [Methanomicrobia archaeon]|nr:class I SAM-dependent methyltransferase [Methanomicrobia archaeon]
MEERLKEDDEGRIERAEILRRWNVHNKTVLDIGVGPLAIIAARDFNCTVMSIDVAEDKLQEAERDVETEGLAAQITVEYGDATALWYPDRSFDVVISYGALHHVAKESRKKFIQELRRVAKETVIIVELNARGFKHIHEFDDFTPVDLDWLERAIHPLGAVEKYQGRLMNVYALSFW